MPMAKSEPRAASDSGKTKLLHNELEGVESARQLDETVAQFLKRLPPGSSSFIGPWIWITNPVVEGKGKSEREDQGGSNLFNPRCTALLKDYETAASKIESEMEGKAQGTITRRLTPLRTKLKEGLISTAIEARCVCGKASIISLVQSAASTNSRSGCCFQRQTSSVALGDSSQKV